MSPVGLCNLALSHLGHQAVVSAIDPPEASYEAQMCATFYPIARDNTLEMAVWSFATRRKALATLTNDSDRWAFAYARPVDLLKPLAILMPQQSNLLPVVWTDPELRSWLGDPDMQRFDYIVESQSTGTVAIYTNVEDAVLLYTAQSTDTTKWSSLFGTAVSYLLASMLAGPLTKDPRLQGAMLQAAESITGAAHVSDANARQFNPFGGTPGAVLARG